MALRQESVNMEDRRHSRPSNKRAAFRTHMAVYLGVGLFLFTLNLLTSPFHLWFYWPLFFWGWCLALHAAVTYGADAPSRVLEDLRSLVPWVSGALPASSPDAQRTADDAPFAAEAFAAVHERMERLKESAWQLADGDMRQQADRFCAEAEQVVAAMARERADAETVRRFDAELLAPAEAILQEYGYVVSHDAPDSVDIAQRIADHDLPLLRVRLDALTGKREDVERPAATGFADAAFGAEPSAPHGLPLQCRS